MADLIGMDPLAKAILHLKDATEAKKCWSCGCLHDTLASIHKAAEKGPLPQGVMFVAREADSRLVGRKYDCLGCGTCHPALAVNAFNAMGKDSLDLEACPSDAPSPREGWPPLPGNYRVLRYQAPVAICTLTDETLMRKVVEQAPEGLSVVGCLMTENLGIERLITNIASNPHIRFLIVCGQDSQQAVGHLPGKSLLALSKNGLDDQGRIIGAPGKRPNLKNVPMQVVEHFRETVGVIDQIGEVDLISLVKVVAELVSRNPGTASSFSQTGRVQAIRGSVPEKMVSDPMGYFVVYVDRIRNLLVMEHYHNDGVLTALIEGRTAAELYSSTIGRNLISRLDHAAYLGRELARAETSLETGATYVQDAAPESMAPTASSEHSCDCGSKCEGGIA